jgi:hypothetical protein
MSQQKRDYDSTVARIAGNIACELLRSSWKAMPRSSMGDRHEAVANAAVHLARAIVAEVKRTEPAEPSR